MIVKTHVVDPNIYPYDKQSGAPAQNLKNFVEQEGPFGVKEYNPGK